MEHIKEVIKRLPAGQKITLPLNSSGARPEESTDTAELLRKSLGVSSLSNTFASFVVAPGTEKALDTFKKFAEGNLGTPLLLCVGGYGCGKTHLLEAFAIRRRELGYFARVVKFHKFLDTLKNTFRDGALPTYDQIMGNYLASSLVCLDDIGMGNKETPWVVSVLEALIDHRYHERLETVMTTNMDLRDLPPRVMSRLNDRQVCTIVLNQGKDYRVKKDVSIANR